MDNLTNVGATRRHLEVFHAGIRRQRIDDGVHDSGRRGAGSGLAEGFGTEEVSARDQAVVRPVDRWYGVSAPFGFAQIDDEDRQLFAAFDALVARCRSR
jgi:hypothetical protein